MINAIVQDIRLAYRRWIKTPGYCAVIVGTVGLGLGLVVFVFSLVNAVVLHPLPFVEPERLVQVLKEWKPYWLDNPEITPVMEQREIRAWQNEKSIMADVAAYQSRTAGLLLSGETEIVGCGEVSSSIFSVLGIPLALGRCFLPEEGLPGGPAAAILSHKLWRTRFGEDPDIVGRRVTLDRKLYTVVGVLPASFRFFKPNDIYIPLVLDGKTFVSPNVIARLKSDMSPARVGANLNRLYKQAGDPKENGRVFVVPLQQYIVGDTKNGLLLYLGAVALVLLIACANVANLLLARTAYRRKELALRMALGSGKWRIVRQVLTECLLLAYAGAGIGLLLTAWARLLLQPLLAKLPGIATVQIDVSVVVFAFLAASVVALFFGLTSAMDACRFSPIHALKEGMRGRQHRCVRQLFVVAEVMLATALLFGSGLLLKNYLRIQGVDLGFRPQKILYARLELDPARYPDSRSQAAYFEQAIMRLSALPGVEAVGADAAPPLSGWTMAVTGPVLEGRTLTVQAGCVSPDYFRVMGIPLIKGRFFENQDRMGKAKVLVVNESFVRTYLSDREPLGKRIEGENEQLTIVGVVGDVRHSGPAIPAQPQFYTCCLQDGQSAMSLVIRTRDMPMKLAGAARSQILGVDAQMRVPAFMTLEDRLAETLAPQRINMWLSTFIGLLAVVLSVLGIYGMLSYSVVERTHEIGIRMALGAQAQNVIHMIVGEGLVLTVGGMFFAILAAYWFWEYVGSWMEDLAVLDWPTMASACLLLGTIALAASYIPARRAVKVDPLVALRSE